ncbi:DUF1799 domain-containing protein [Pseudomonas sp. C2L11]|nr:DUF1799 domain-containing protein [Pseudomonas typographi]
MYEPKASAVQLAAFGLSSDDFDGDAEVWPDAWPAFCAFEAMSTQWRVGMGGAVGLDYNALPVVLELAGIRKRDRSAVFDDLRVMEAEALAVMAEQRQE